jgi:hypothetical protein
MNIYTKVGLGLLIGILGYYAFNTYQSNASAPSYQNQVQRVEDIERQDPLKFLKVSGNYNENFWGNKYKINCTIENLATVAQYKDVTIRITYFTKTNSVLATEDRTFYEYFPPTSSKDVQMKVPTYYNANRIELSIVQAKTA